MATTPDVHSPEFLAQAQSNPVTARPKKDYAPVTLCNCDQHDETHFHFRDEYLSLNDELRNQITCLSSVKLSPCEFFQKTIADAAWNIAVRVANCRRHATLVNGCKRLNYGEGWLHRCGDIMDPYCGRGKSRRMDWMGDRDGKAVFVLSHVGIELSMPASDEFYWLEYQDRLQALATKFVERMDCPYVIQDAAPYMNELSPRVYLYLMDDKDRDDSDKYRVNLRLALQVDRVSTAKAEALWQEIAGPGAGCRFKSSGGATGHGAEKIFDWVFGGFEDILRMRGEERARFRIELIDEDTGKTRRMVRAGGECYRTVEHKPIDNTEPRVCPCAECQAERSLLLQFSLSEQHTESVDHLMGKYKIMTWLHPRAQAITQEPDEVLSRITPEHTANSVASP